jgi:aspartate/methionine/tyrosine aminotransferase
MSFVNKGDECIIFEPSFPFFIDNIKMAGGKLKTVPLYLDDKS